MSSPDHMVDAQHKVSLAYWTAETNRAPETAGVAGMGGCGDLEVFYRHHEELDHLLKIVEFTPEKTVVELGCGTGRWVVSLAGRVKHYTGLDFSPTALAVVRRRAAELGLTNVTFLEGSAADFVPEGPIHVF
jgi:methylase of polypeptide subunit release factors